MKLFNKLLNNIGKFIDRVFVMPVTRLIVKVNKFLNNNSKKFERFLMKKSTLVFISLIIALGYFFLVDIQNVNLTQNTAEVLYNQSVTAIYNEEKYVIEGLPSTVDITLIGRKSDIYLARQIKNHEITVDLSNLKAGTHKVKLEYNEAIDTINYKLDPSSVTIVIYNKESVNKTLSVDLLNVDSIDPKLNVKMAYASSDTVIVKGAAHVLEKVAMVKALVDLNDIPNLQVGDNTLDSVPVVAYDELGNILDVEILPNKLSVTVVVDSPSKVVPLEFVPSGEVQFGKAIKEITSDITTVTIYGDQSILSQIESIPVTIDVAELSSNKTYNINIDRPAGIKFMSNTRVKVTVNIESETSKEIEAVKLTPLNLGAGLNVEPLTKEDSEVTVIVKGTQSVLDTITSSSEIQGFIDLAGLTAGTHEVEVTIKGQDLRASYTPKVKKVTVRIY